MMLYSLRQNVPILLLATLLIISCGGDKDKNTPPEILSITPTYTGGDTAFSTDALYAGMKFVITVEASDADGDPMSFDFSSDQGIFSGITPSSSGCSAGFEIRAAAALEAVSVTVTVSDSAGEKASQSALLGTARGVPAASVAGP